jgi:predicted permease
VASGLNRLVANLARPALGLLGPHLLGVPPLELSAGLLLLAAPTAVASYSVAADLEVTSIWQAPACY